MVKLILLFLMFDLNKEPPYVDYFDRIECLQYAIANDDGQRGINLEKADIIFFGVSRTSKVPCPH